MSAMMQHVDVERKNCVTLSIYSAQILRYLLMVPLNKIVMMGTYLAPLFWICNFAILWYLYWPVSLGGAAQDMWTVVTITLQNESL